jgi:hypothetical protein
VSIPALAALVAMSRIVEDHHLRVVPRRRIGRPQIGRNPTGRREPDADLVAPIGRPAAKVEHGAVVGEVGEDRIERAEPALTP